MAKLRQLPAPQQETGLQMPGLITTLLGHVLTQQRQEEANTRLLERQTEANKQIVERQELGSIRTAERQGALDLLKRQRELELENIKSANADRIMRTLVSDPTMVVPGKGWTEQGLFEAKVQLTRENLPVDKIASLLGAVVGPPKIRVEGDTILEVAEGPGITQPSVRKLQELPLTKQPVAQASYFGRAALEAGFSDVQKIPKAELPRIVARSLELEKSFRKMEIDYNLLRDADKTFFARVDDTAQGRGAVMRLKTLADKLYTADGTLLERFKQAIDSDVMTLLNQTDREDLVAFKTLSTALVQRIGMSSFRQDARMSDKDAERIEGAVKANFYNSKKVAIAILDELLGLIDNGIVSSYRVRNAMRKTSESGGELSFTQTLEMYGALDPPMPGASIYKRDDKEGTIVWKLPDGSIILRTYGEHIKPSGR